MAEFQGVRKWTDQPEFLEEGKHLCSCRAGDKSVQVIVDWLGIHYVTVGNLFVSQTIKCGAASDAFKCLDMISKGVRDIDKLKAQGFTVINDGDNEG